MPPAALRQFLGMYGTLLTELRGRPRALAEIVHRGGGPPESAVQLLLSTVPLPVCSLYVHCLARKRPRWLTKRSVSRRAMPRKAVAHAAAGKAR